MGKPITGKVRCLPAKKTVVGRTTIGGGAEPKEIGGRQHMEGYRLQTARKCPGNKNAKTFVKTSHFIVNKPLEGRRFSAWSRLPDGTEEYMYENLRKKQGTKDDRGK